ncbi:MAG: hypothetical protein O2829_09185 [Bacteroidetes bacterium]|nr:hypothetical protein [Bacteroidota bacterium]
MSNQKTLDLMKSGLIPPAKGDPKHNPEYEGIDTFEAMAQKGLWIIDRVVQEELKGGVDLSSNSWYIQKK